MNSSKLMDKLITELAEQAATMSKEERVSFGKWAVEQSIAARGQSFSRDDQEMFNVSEALIAAGLYTMLAGKKTDEEDKKQQ